MLLSSRQNTHRSVAGHWMQRTALVVTVTLLTSLFGNQSVQAQDTPLTNTPADSQTYLIQFQQSLDESQRTAWLARQGVELVAWLPQINVAEVRLLAGAEDTLAVAASDAAAVVFVENDAPVSGDLAITDPAYGNLDQSYGQQLLGVPAALDVTEGDGDIVIAIVDTGINLNHPEFKDRLVAGYDYVNNDTDPSDDHGHGTHIAGIVAAGRNGVGTVGVCPQCKLMPVKVLNARNGGTWSLVTKGILYAVDHGARVINLSLGSSVSSATLENAIKYADAHGVVVVAAAGNTGCQTTFYPAAIPSVLAVSGTDRNDVRWTQSSYGDYVDIAAPAVAIYSTYHDLEKTSGYAYMSGTSMATPFVTGLVGLTLSRRPDLSVNEVIAMIASNAVDLGAVGKDAEYGHGRIDVYATLLAANGGVAPITQTPPSDGSGEGDPGKGVVSTIYLPAISANQPPSPLAH